MRIFIFVLLFHLSLVPANGQTKREIDSLITVMRQQFARGKLNNLSLPLSILKRANTINYQKAAVQVLNTLAVLKFTEGQSDSAQYYIDLAYGISLKLNEPSLLIEYHWFKAGVYNSQKQYPTSYSHLIQALDYAKINGSKHLARLYESLSTLFDSSGNPELALHYINEALNIDSTGVEEHLQKLSLLSQMERIEEASSELSKVKELSKNKEEATLKALTMEGWLLARNGDPTTVKHIHYTINRLNSSARKPTVQLIHAYLTLASYYIDSRSDSAMIYLAKVEKELPPRNAGLRAEYLKLMSRLHFKSGHYKDAYLFKDRWFDLEDSSKNISVLNRIHEIDLARLEDARQIQQQDYVQQIKDSKRNLSIFGTLGFTILILSLMLLFIFVRLRKIHRKLKIRKEQVERLNLKLKDSVEQKTHELQETLQKVKDRNLALEKIAWTYSHEFRAPFSRLEGLMRIVELDHSNETMVKIAPMMKQVIQEVNTVISAVVSATTTDGSLYVD